MNAKSNSFPGKILLFGEYTILIGSSALSIPYNGFTASLTFSDPADPNTSRAQVSSNRQLLEFYQFLIEKGDHFSHIIDFERFHREMGQGLYLQSTIPAGYGLGSSGALVAAVFERYSKQPPFIQELINDEEMLRLKTILAEMESFFHGKSSGFDPMVSFLKKPLLLRPDGIPELINLPEPYSTSGSGIFLLDTKQTGKTAPLVRFFLERFKPEGNMIGEGTSLVNLIDELTDSFLRYTRARFWDLLKKLSLYQIMEFKPMIPGKFIPLWSEGIESGHFYLKLLGSGGGGYLLGFAPDLQETIDFLKSKGYSPVPVSV